MEPKAAAIIMTYLALLALGGKKVAEKRKLVRVVVLENHAAVLRAVNDGRGLACRKNGWGLHGMPVR